MREDLFTIRAAIPSDNILLAEMGRQTFFDSFAADNTPENMAAYLDGSFSPQKQAAELADPNTTFLIIEAEGEPVGYARLQLGRPLECTISGEHPIEIVRFYSVKSWIGKGVGPALMQACLRETQRRGCDSIWLDVWEQNSRAVAFYRKWGFEVIGSQAFRLGDELQNDLLMQRMI